MVVYIRMNSGDLSNYYELPKKEIIRTNIRIECRIQNFYWMTIPSNDADNLDTWAIPVKIWVIVNAKDDGSSNYITFLRHLSCRDHLYEEKRIFQAIMRRFAIWLICG
jgi:hypothetical protein